MGSVEETCDRSFILWIRHAISEHRRVNPDIDMDLVRMSVPPQTVVSSFKRITAYGNHYRVLDQYTAGLTTYDSGLLTTFNQRHAHLGMQVKEMGYVGELVDVWRLNYGAVSTPVILMKGVWVRSAHTGYRPGMRIDRHGFFIADFRSTLPEWEDPFVFPWQVEQAFFLDVEEERGCRVIMHKDSRSRRIHGTVVPFSLHANAAFENLEKQGRKQPADLPQTDEDAVPLTAREAAQLTRNYELEEIPSDLDGETSESSEEE